MPRWFLPGAIVIVLTLLSVMFFSGSPYSAPIGAFAPGVGWMMPGGMIGGLGGWGFRRGIIQQNASTTDVKTWLDRLVAINGNPHIKSGNVTEKDENTITAEIVTTDKGGLVERFLVDRKTGFVRADGD